VRAPAYLPAYTDRKGFWTLDGDAIRWLDVVLFAATGALRIWPVFVLGRRFSGLVAIQPATSWLLTASIVSRHPSYLGLLVNSLGWALAFRKQDSIPRSPARATTIWRQPPRATAAIRRLILVLQRRGLSPAGVRPP
jgi:hypothetical protein